MGSFGKAISGIASSGVGQSILGAIPGGNIIGKGLSLAGGIGAGLAANNNRNLIFGSNQVMGGQPASSLANRQDMSNYFLGKPSTGNYGNMNAGVTQATGGQIGQVDQAQGAQLGGAPQFSGAQLGGYDPAQMYQMGASPMTGAAQAGMAPYAHAAHVAQAPGVGTAQIGGVDQTQSAAELANSPFLSQLMQPYQAQFTQNRNMALAQAKEQSGNLTGSGYANALGNTVNRSLADENAQLATVAQNQIGQEIQRQGAQQGVQAGLQTAQGQLGQQSNNLFAQLQAGRNQQQADLSQQANLANQGLQGQYGLTNAQLQQQSLLSNQNLAGQYGLQQGQFGQAANMFNAGNSYNAALQNALFGQQAGLANQSLLGQYGMQQGQFNQAANLQNNQYANQNAQMQAQLMQQLGITNAGYANDAANQNAQRYAGLLGQFTNAGVGPGQVVSQPGLIDSAANLYGKIAGARAGQPAPQPQYPGPGGQQPYNVNDPNQNIFAGGLTMPSGIPFPQQLPQYLPPGVQNQYSL